MNGQANSKKHKQNAHQIMADYRVESLKGEPPVHRHVLLQLCWQLQAVGPLA